MSDCGGYREDEYEDIAEDTFRNPLEIEANRQKENDAKNNKSGKKAKKKNKNKKKKDKKTIAVQEKVTPKVDDIVCEEKFEDISRNLLVEMRSMLTAKIIFFLSSTHQSFIKGNLGH